MKLLNILLEKDLRKEGLIFYSELQFDIVGIEDLDRVRLELYNHEGYLTSYQYWDREEAEQDLEEITKEHGIVFTPFEDFTTSVIKVMNLNKKAI